MLVLLSCHYRDSVQASLQKQKTRAVSEGEGQNTGAELLSIAKGGTGNKYFSLTHDGLGSQRCWAENLAVGSCRVREEDICFLCLLPSGAGALFTSPEHPCQPKAFLPSHSSMHTCAGMHPPILWPGTADLCWKCRSQHAWSLSCWPRAGQCHSSGREGWLPPPHLELCEEDRSPTCATSTGLCDFQKPLPT